MKNCRQRSVKNTKVTKPRKKVRERTNVGASAESKVEAAEGSTETRRKDDNGCTEVRNREEVPAFT